MLLTERKALMTIFEQLQQDKRELRSVYRADMEKIEQRENDILNRLERLDTVERESVDVEGVLTSLCETADNLSKLIPEVPIADIVEHAAAILAKDAKEKEITITGSKQTAEAAQEEKEKEIQEAIQQEAGKVKLLHEEVDFDQDPFKRKPIEKVMKAIYHIYKQSNKKVLNTNQILKKLKKDFNMQWRSDKMFQQLIWRMKKDYPKFIVKEKGRGAYSLHPEFDPNNMAAAAAEVIEVTEVPEVPKTEGGSANETRGIISEAEAIQKAGINQHGGDRQDDRDQLRENIDTM